MTLIAKGMITLSSVNDPFSVVLSPSSCTIRSDYNGAIGQSELNHAYTNIQVLRGENPTEFEITLEGLSNNGIQYEIKDLPSVKSKQIKINKIPSGLLAGELTFKISVGTDFGTIVIFPFSVIRESSMLDWIQEWNGRRTMINGEYIITPKAFFGYKNPTDGYLTGVYLGPSLDSVGDTGIYGFKDNKEIFFIDNTGARIGGWEIQDAGLQTADGAIKILSEGSIISHPDKTVAWGLYKDGSATFANGNVTLKANGDASFKGELTALCGKVGGWSITNTSLYNSCLILNANEQFIGLLGNVNTIGDDVDQAYFKKALQQYGGISIYHNTINDFGIEGWSHKHSGAAIKVFSIGSTNLIAGWNFDEDSIYRGVKCNTAKQTTKQTGEITIGSNGLRGQNWYIDSDGEISFVNGLLSFNKDSGRIGDWQITPSSLLTQKVALVSNNTEGGIYLCPESLICSSSLYTSKIAQYGGIYLRTNGESVELQGWSKINGSIQKIFGLSSDGISQIGAWTITDTALYKGNERNVSGTFTPSTGDITIGTNGIRGLKWRLDADGGGAIAGGKIAWDTNGNMTLDSTITLSWSQITDTESLTNKLTKIDANGIYTGTINADNITSGTISANLINVDELLSNGEKWALQKDGSGYLANKNIEWDENGELNVQGNLSIRTLKYQGNNTNPFDSPDGERIVRDAFSVIHLNRNNILKVPHLKDGECSEVKIFSYAVSRVPGTYILKVDDSRDKLCIGVMNGSKTPASQIDIANSAELGSRCHYLTLIGIGGEREKGETIWHIFPSDTTTLS